jgi:uncharacterized protein YbjT (DUF2867 family)
MSTTYLITGATGTIGSRVVELLLARGERPAVFVRDVDKARRRFGDRVDVLCGDLADSESLAAGFSGVHRVLLINSGPKLGHRDKLAAHAARACGVERLVKLSTFDVEFEVGTGPWHALGESAIRASGGDFTFIRASGFMDNALAWAPAIASSGVVESVTGNGKIAFIHSDDIAGVAAAALTADTNEYRGQSLPITGPCALTTAQMVAAIGAVTGKSPRVEHISDDYERQRWIDRGEPSVSIDYHLSIFKAIRQGRLAQTTDAVECILGRPAIGFDRWVAENAAAFT